MSTSNSNVKNLIREIEKKQAIDEYSKQLSPLNKDEIEKLRILLIDNSYADVGIKQRIDQLENQLNIRLNHISGKEKLKDNFLLKGSIENYIGMAQIPIGVAGPLLVHGLYAQGLHYVPMATTEGTIVASYNRGMKVCLLSGGITAVCLTDIVKRSPLFKFKDIFNAGRFIIWVNNNFEELQNIALQVSEHAKLLDVKTNFEGNTVILTFEYSTGDASGQNIVTLCTASICKYILAHFPEKPSEWYIESNYSGDKKATANSFTNVKGKKVTAEVIIKKDIIRDVLKSDAKKMCQYWRASTLAAMQSGAIGAQGHITNGLAAIYIACGQEVSSISESSVGLTRMEITDEGDLYASLTLPSLVVGTIDGGTKLPTQKECLEMLGCYGANNAKKFAEICASMALAGEISIASALSNDQFARSIQKRG